MRACRMACGPGIRRIERLRAQGFVYVLDADIVDYFGQIDHENLMEAFQRHVSDESVAHLVRQWVQMAGLAPSRPESQLRGISQGGVISPLLANLYPDVFDERIEKLGYKLVRYADDFVVLCRSREAAEQALLDVAVLPGELHLELNREKTRVTSFQEGFQYLGYFLAGSLALKSRKAKILQSGSIRSGSRKG